MQIREIKQRLGLSTLSDAGEDGLVEDVRFGHASDLLSDVLANAPAGCVLVTIQVHMNVIAVAMHAGVAAVIFSSGMVPDEEVKKRAAGEKLFLFSSQETTFTVVGRMYELGIIGAKR
jgi:predicted transcriptional regulator